MAVKVMITDDHSLIREGLKQLLELEGDFQVIDIEGLQLKRHFCFVSAQGQESDTVLNFMRFVRHFLSGK